MNQFFKELQKIIRLLVIFLGLIMIKMLGITLMVVAVGKHSPYSYIILSLWILGFLIIDLSPSAVKAYVKFFVGYFAPIFKKKDS